MRKLVILLALAAQFVYVAGMVAEREHLVRTGETVYLRTTPVDPRDLFRGDYVTLAYDINAVGADALRGNVDDYRENEGVPIYAQLQPLPGSDDLYHLQNLTDIAPETGPYVAGRTTRDWRFRRLGSATAARYGIEKLFVEQGKGLEIEDKRGEREGLQIPMEVELAVGGSGKAAIRGYRWSPMGLEFEVLRQDQRTPAELRRIVQNADDGTDGADPDGADPDGADPEEDRLRSPEVRMTLHNVSDEVRWIVDPGDHCSFRLVPAVWGSREWPSAHDGCEGVVPTVDDLHRLEPGGTYAVTLDLEEPRWQLEQEGEALTLAELDPQATGRFRIVYRPETTWADGLAQEGEPWLAELPSPAFTAIGRVD